LIETNAAQIFSDADLVVKYYSQLEASRLLNNLILYITQHSEYTFLQSYLEYLAPRHTETLIQYFEFRSKAPFAGFHPKILIKSLRTSSDNKWRQKTRLLFDTLLTYLRMPSDRSHYQPISRVKAAISQNSPLDFASLGGMLRLFYLSPEKYRRRYRPMGDLGLGDCINNMIRHGIDDNIIHSTGKLTKSCFCSAGSKSHVSQKRTTCFAARTTTLVLRKYTNERYT
jgi:hypothetical protein